MALLKKNKALLIAISKAEPALARRIISTADRSLIQTLSECAHNLLIGNIKLSAKRKRDLSRFKTKLRTIAAKRNSIQVKKKTLQSGGFLISLISALTPLLYKGVSALVQAIKRRKSRKG